jgi:hypothetical protein
MSQQNESYLSAGRFLIDRFLRAAERAASFANKHYYFVVLALTIAYFADTLFRASRKLFWFDELFTLYVSRLPNLKSLWDVLMAGVELNPPVLYIFTRWSNSLFGEGQVSLRLPAIVGFWIFCLSLFQFVRKRSTPLGGFVAMLFPMVTLAYWYAIEARPYGIELGFCGIALICWQALADHAPGRVAWLIGLVAALAGALLAHGYAFLVFIPIVIGEMARTYQRRRVDWVIWGAIAISSLAILVSVPLSLALKRSLIPNEAAHASLAGLVTNYIVFLKPAAYVVIGWLALMYFAKEKAPHPSPSRGTLPLHEGLALLAFAAIPIFQALSTKLTGAPTFARYSIPFIAGPACLLGLISARRPVVAVGTLGLLLAQIGADAAKFRSDSTLVEPSVSHPISTSLSRFRARYEWMEAPEFRSLPIALLDRFDFLPIAFYAPPELVARLTYVSVLKPDVVGIMYDRLRVSCGVPFGPPVYFQDFISSHETFLAFGGREDLPILNQFIQKGASVVVRKMAEDAFLVTVTTPKTAAAPEQIDSGYVR